jgi:hypothetical protein
MACSKKPKTKSTKRKLVLKGPKRLENATISAAAVHNPVEGPSGSLDDDAMDIYASDHDHAPVPRREEEEEGTGDEGRNSNNSDPSDEDSDSDLPASIQVVLRKRPASHIPSQIPGKVAKVNKGLLDI